MAAMLHAAGAAAAARRFWRGAAAAAVCGAGTANAPRAALVARRTMKGTAHAIPARPAAGVPPVFETGAPRAPEFAPGAVRPPAGAKRQAPQALALRNNFNLQLSLRAKKAEAPAPAKAPIFNGRVTVRGKCSRHPRLIRKVDFKRGRADVGATVLRLEHDPGRTARVALVRYDDGVLSYVLAAAGVAPGDRIFRAAAAAPLKPGNSMPLGQMPPGTHVHNIELRPGFGGQLVRAASTFAKILRFSDFGGGSSRRQPLLAAHPPEASAPRSPQPPQPPQPPPPPSGFSRKSPTLPRSVENGYAKVELPSKEIRRFPEACCATVGAVSAGTLRRRIGRKAGENRWKGIGPKVSGRAMHKHAHPHGGEFRNHPTKSKPPRNLWNKPALNFITRPPGKPLGDILQQRPRKAMENKDVGRPKFRPRVSAQI